MIHHGKIMLDLCLVFVSFGVIFPKLSGNIFGREVGTMQVLLMATRNPARKPGCIKACK